jgi:hypothetical protein
MESDAEAGGSFPAKVGGASVALDWFAEIAMTRNLAQPQFITLWNTNFNGVRREPSHRRLDPYLPTGFRETIRALDELLLSTETRAKIDHGNTQVIVRAAQRFDGPLQRPDQTV